MLFFLFVLLSFFSPPQQSSVAGTWVTIDDGTGKEKSVVTLYEEKGYLVGQIDALLLPEDAGKLCVNCSGDLKNQPIEGMRIINGLTLEGNSWTEGTILDPANGKTYDCTLRLEDENILLVRGYIGFSFIGRTQKWVRKK
jgi:uncharacterized protein (DUF2147 family)